MKKSVHKDAIISSVFVVKIDKGRGFIEKTYPFYQKHSVIILLGALIPVPVHGKGGKEDVYKRQLLSVIILYPF